MLKITLGSFLGVVLAYSFSYVVRYIKKRREDCRWFKEYMKPSGGTEMNWRDD